MSPSNMQHKQQDMLARMRDILGERYIVLQALSYELREDFESGNAEITCTVSNKTTGNDLLTVQGRGTGLIDALFHGLRNEFAKRWPSLDTIQFHDFAVRGIMSTRTDNSGSDAEAQVTLTVVSSEHVEFTFTSTSRSIGRASVDATLQAVGYFLNSEKAFIEIYNILQHYRKEGRVDLVTKYQLLLSQMVENTSYTEVIQQIRTRELSR